MPRLGKATESQKAIAAELREQFGGALTLVQVGNVIGARSPKTAREWVSDIPHCIINDRKKYLVSDVAKKISENRYVP